MPANLSQGNCQYTPFAATGTTTVSPGVPVGSGAPSNPNVLYGAYVAAPGTTFSINVFDVIRPSGLGTNTATTSNLIMSGTGTAVGQTFTPMGAPMGVRLKGDMVAVLAGTPGQINLGWD